MFIATMAMSQTVEDYIEISREVLQTEKKAAIAEIMDLTVDEAKVFWPLYNQYNEQMYIIQSKRVKIIKEFAANIETMTDEKADEIFTEYFKYRLELVKLNKAYYGKFKKILFAAKAARYMQAENKIAVLIDYELAEQIPFIEARD